VSLLVTEEWLKKLEPYWSQRSEEMDAYVGEKKLLGEIIGHDLYQGVMAVGRIPPAPSLEEVLERSPRPWLFVALDGINNAENLGALVRNCGAFGVHAVLVGETSGSPYLRRAVRASMGVVLGMPVVELTDLVGTLGFLKAKGVSCVAAHPHSDGHLLSAADLTSDACIVLGNEGDGISAPVLEACSDAVEVPMSPGVDSLNVGSASAVFLYEVSRQRGNA